MPRNSSLVRILRIYSLLSISVLLVSAEDQQTERAFFSARFLEARAAYKNDKSNARLAINYAASAFEWAEHASNRTQRSAIAEPAITACRKHLHAEDQEAEARYYLALNLGQLARTKYLGALSIVKEMEANLLAAKAIKPNTNHAGIDRALSQLYSQAPKWPTSVGSRSKALKHAREAIKISPDYPGNQINFLEILIEQKRWAEARASLPGALIKIESAKEPLRSQYWSFSWSEWNQKLRGIQITLKTTVE